MIHLDALTLECFVAASETGSFTKAANRVARTQSAVSQQIIKLEQQLGKTLFNRNKDLFLTADGEILLSYARKIVSLNNEAVDRFKQPELRGEIRFGLPEDFVNVFLSEVLADYSSSHPLISINIDCDLTLNLFERFKNKEFDLVLLKMNKPDEFPDGIDVWTESLVWVAGNADLQLEDDKPIPLVLSPQPCVYRERAIKALEEINKKWRVVFSSYSYAGKIAAVEAGMGVTVIPRNMVNKNLRIINNLGFPELESAHVSLLKHNSKDPVIKSFEDFVVQRLHD